MATFTLCDICAAPATFRQREMWKLKVHVGDHPHDNKPLFSEIDICSACLRFVEDSHTPQTVEEIRARLTDGA